MRPPTKSKKPTPRRAAGRLRGLNLRHILVPLDFSGLSRQALDCAVPLARKYRAKISLIHVAQSPAGLGAMPDGGLVLPVNLDRLKEVAEMHLVKLAAQLLPDELRGQLVVREGRAAAEVVAAAQALKVDLIVLSTNGRSGLKRMLLGSTAERIVGHAPCPVLTVRRRRRGPAERLAPDSPPVYPAELPWRRILVPLDFSLTSLRALQTAVPLAQASGARLQLLHVVEPNPYAAGMEAAVLLMPDREVAHLAKKQLVRVARKLIPARTPVTVSVQMGPAATTIVTTAETSHADLIVLAMHQHPGLNRLLMGHTAEQVVRHAKGPVFVIRKS